MNKTRLSSPTNFRLLYPIHRFHHKYNAIVLPSSASAVSHAEFIFAYMTPFVVAAWGSGTDKHLAMTAVFIVSLFNLIIHTPALEKTFERYPSLFVSPADHLAHHRQLTCHYSGETNIQYRTLLHTWFAKNRYPEQKLTSNPRAAPIFHFDRIISFFREALCTIFIMTRNYHLGPDDNVEATKSM